ncbi:MAG: hypothetical protein K9M82_10245 [Deltaproteobacteria bacterium]|nr:hypothetical protein [Deltaproteobacteria bacterium]
MRPFPSPSVKTRTRTENGLRRSRGLSCSLVLFSWIVCLPLFAAGPFEAPAGAETLQPERIDREGIAEGIQHLLEIADPSAKGRLDPSLVRPILAFIASEKEAGRLYHTGERDGAASAYNEFGIRKNLSSVIQYAYNPDIPANVFRPSSIRLTQWLEVNGEKQSLPRLWTHLPNPDPPVVVTGVEYEENTPDQTTGACYRYTMDRALVLFRDKGRNVFISISKQPDPSDKGKKGACLGGDRNWDYLYTGEEGLTRSGLGWADTRIYESASIAVYYEIDRAFPLVRCGVFKWIRAGWAGLNVVKERHIYQGMERFARGFRETIHHPRLPEPTRLAHMFDWIRNIPEKSMQSWVNDYLSGLRSRYGDEKVLSKDDFEELLEAGDYAGRMTRPQMESLLSLEYMKWILGMSTVLGEVFRLAPDMRGKRVYSLRCAPPG